jgi:hypothetical protein
LHQDTALTNKQINKKIKGLIYFINMTFYLTFKPSDEVTILLIYQKRYLIDSIHMQICSDNLRPPKQISLLNNIAGNTSHLGPWLPSSILCKKDIILKHVSTQ